MKLATYKDGSRDGQLVVVSRDLASAHFATGIATRMQQAIGQPACRERLGELRQPLVGKALLLQVTQFGGAQRVAPRQCRGSHHPRPGSRSTRIPIAGLPF